MSKLQPASYARDLNRDGSSATVFPASQNDWAVMVFDGGGSIGDSALGTSRTLDRAEPFLVTPEKLEPCLTEDPFLARQSHAGNVQRLHALQGLHTSEKP
ncbi:hypothetical protein EJ065_4354 [Corallococcus coralloides]|uniref:Uncharacterized protein n=1 Tax=Corallococcus coralloides TaxID=184914 RepID=A0A410RVK2_CORCK|nr:hypothetical protein [Corallococcus coralloides]QAT85907.1 hypothetical protein EJ065_4354 [Corallococcus coralloides]